MFLLSRYAMNEIELKRVVELNWETKSHRHRSSTLSHIFPCSNPSKDLIPHCSKQFREADKNKGSQQGK